MTPAMNYMSDAYTHIIVRSSISTDKFETWQRINELAVGDKTHE